MTKEKSSWISITTGLIFLFAGVRDIVAPGFLTMSSRTPDSGVSSVCIILGLLFLSLPAARNAKKKRTKQ